MTLVDKPGPVADQALTIDQLARRVGMTVRNLREWRALGLLGPPAMRGRVGYYDAGEVARIGRIRALHAQGFTLDLIRRLLDSSGELGDEAMRLAVALRAPFREEDPPLVDVAELATKWGSTDPGDLRRAIELGLIRERDDGRFEFTSARVARVGDALHRLGLSVEETLEATAEIRAHADGIAEVFERVWLRHVWEPFVEAGAPSDGLPQIKQTLAEVQPLALDAVIGLFKVAMEETIERSIADQVERAVRGATTG
jgi:DNA-binding transcriptional MerR regulator